VTDKIFASLREAPRPEFAASLKRRLDEIEQEQEARAFAPSLARRLRPAFAGLAVVALLAMAFTLPSVRAAATSLLELFRVKRFAAVPVGGPQLAQLRDRKLDLKTLISDQVEVLEEPTRPEVVVDVAAAADQAGLPVSKPSRLPRECSLAEVRVSGRGAFRATLDTAKIEQLAEALGVSDLEIPEEWNGTTAEVATAPVVALRYLRGKDEFVLFQSHSPEIKLPEGVDLARLGTIGLRLAGMSADEARLFAAKIDWRATALVPVPADGGDFRDVEVQGGPGLLVSARRPARPASDGRRSLGRWQSVLLWSRGEKVYALQGPGRGVELLEMADSIG